MLYLKILSLFLVMSFSFGANTCKTEDECTYQDFLNEKLIKDIKGNNLEYVKKWVAQGADINHRFEETNVTMLMLALHSKSDEAMISYLIENGAFINAKNKSGLSAITFALYHQHPLSVIKKLVAKEANLHEYTFSKDNEKINNLARYICGLNLVNEESLIIIDYLIDKGLKITPIVLACSVQYKNNNWRILIDHLLSKITDINIKSETHNSNVLHIINQYKESILNQEIVKLFIEKGLNVNHINNKNLSPLRQAAKKGNFDNVNLYLDHGANPLTTPEIVADLLNSDQLSYASDAIKRSEIISLLERLFNYGLNIEEIKQNLIEIAMNKRANEIANFLIYKNIHLKRKIRNMSLLEFLLDHPSFKKEEIFHVVINNNQLDKLINGNTLLYILLNVDKKRKLKLMPADYKYLIDSGSEVTFINFEDQTPLEQVLIHNFKYYHPHYSYSWLDLAILLIENGANPYRINANGNNLFGLVSDEVNEKLYRPSIHVFAKHEGRCKRRDIEEVIRANSLSQIIEIYGNKLDYLLTHTNTLKKENIKIDGKRYCSFEAVANYQLN